MPGFWEHAFSSLGDNVALVNDAIGDLQDNLNPFSDQFMTGDAKRTATEVETQLARDQGRAVNQARIDASSHGGVTTIKDAGVKTGHQVATTAGHTIGTGLDLLTNKWFLAGVALVVVLAVAAPYVAPVLGKLK